jgi:hypothetical protein
MKPQSIKDAWIRARTDIYECDHKILLPIIKLWERSTFAPWNYTSCSGVVIKLEELLSSDGKRLSSMYYRIINGGGPHSYLNFQGPVILSTITRDRAILGLTKELYVELIKNIEPDYFFTPDGENYFNRPNTSIYEVKRILSETNYILCQDLKSKPIGLVKGCCPHEAVEHVKSLLDLGINHHVMHLGDGLSRASILEKKTMYSIYASIVNISPWLLLYGIGSRSNFRLFNKCNGYVTQSHFVYKFNHDSNDQAYGNPIMENLEHIENLLMRFELDDIAYGTQSVLERWL